MSQKTAILISERSLELATFLNDGHRPPIEDNTYLVCEINGPREITTKIEHEDALYQENGLVKDEITILM